MNGIFTDLLFRASINNGQTFGITSHIRENAASSTDFNPQVSSIGENVFLVWQEITFSTAEEIFFIESNEIFEPPC
jgi:hypothetical protein